MRRFGERHALLLALALMPVSVPALSQTPSAAGLIASVPESAAPLDRYAECVQDVVRRGAGARRSFQNSERQFRPVCGPHLTQARQILSASGAPAAAIDQAIRAWYGGLRVSLLRQAGSWQAEARRTPADVEDEEANAGSMPETPPGSATLALAPAPIPVIVGPVPPVAPAPPVHRIVPMPIPRPAEVVSAPPAPEGVGEPADRARIVVTGLAFPLPPEAPPAPIPLPAVVEPVVSPRIPLPADVLALDRSPEGFAPAVGPMHGDHGPETVATVASRSVVLALAPSAKEADVPASPLRDPQLAPATRSPDRGVLQAFERAIDEHRSCLAREVAAAGVAQASDPETARRIARLCAAEEQRRMDLALAYEGGEERLVRQDVLDLTRIEIVTRLRLMRAEGL